MTSRGFDAAGDAVRETPLFSRAEVRAALEAAAPAWIAGRRWFGAKSRTIARARVENIVPLPLAGAEAPGVHLALAYCELSYEDGSHDLYQLALSASVAEHGAETAQTGVITSVPLPDAGEVVVADASGDEAFRQALLHLVASGETLAGNGCTLRARASSVRPEKADAGPLPGRTGSAEQSNTNFLFGDALLLKLFRRLEPGTQPDVEIGRFLTEQAHFDRVPPFFGELSLTTASGAVYATAILQGLIANVGDGWSWTLDRLAAWLAEWLAAADQHEGQGTPVDVPPDHLAAAALLGRRTAEMHLALATETADQAFAAEPFTPADTAAEDARLRTQMERTFDALTQTVSAWKSPGSPQPGERARKQAETLLAARATLLNPSGSSLPRPASGLRIRIHGDYHLGQVLRTADDFVLLDFEGEPARPLEERRQKQCPLRDVAGMLRSFSYVAAAALDQAAKTGKRPRQDSPNADEDAHHKRVSATADIWEKAVSQAFLEAYRTAAAQRADLLPRDADFGALLELYLLEKALYELLYELNNRPLWVHIPLAGILSLSMVRAVAGVPA